VSNMPRIFQIGFNKCGTTSLHRFFLDNGIRSLHWEGGQLAERIASRMSCNEDPVADYRDVVAFTDMIKLTNDVLLEPYKSFQYLHRWYPDAYFILNTRHVDDWIRSRVQHGFLARYRSVLGLADDPAVRRYWRAEWYVHHGVVLEYFRARSARLLVYDIERDRPDAICRFLEPVAALDPSLFSRRNRTQREWRAGSYPEVVVSRVSFSST